MREAMFWRQLLTGLGTLITLVVLGLGAWTRLLDAGLGCPDWPGCYGFILPPADEAGIELANQRYPNWPYELDRAVPEMVHRYAATTLGLLSMALLALVVISRQQWRLPLLLFVVICSQGLLGYLTVSLQLWPQVVVAHLIGGFGVLTLFWLLFRFLARPPPPVVVPVLIPESAPLAGRLRAILWVSLGLLVVQIILGGWVSSNYAALSCPDLPLCQGQWLPPADFASGLNPANQSVGPNYLGGAMTAEARTGIHLSHRLGAILLSCWLLLTGYMLYRRGYKRRALMLIGALSVQLVLGFFNVLSGLSWQIAVAHNLGAAILLLVLVDSIATQYAPRLAGLDPRNN